VAWVSEDFINTEGASLGGFRRGRALDEPTTPDANALLKEKKMGGMD